MKIIKAIMSVPLKLSLYIMGSIIYVLATSLKLFNKCTSKIIKVLILLICFLMSICLVILFLEGNLEAFESPWIIIFFYIVAAIIFLFPNIIKALSNKLETLYKKIIEIASSINNKKRASPDFPKNAIVIHINKINKDYNLFEVSILNTDLIIIFDQEVSLQKLYNQNIISEELLKIQEIINRSSEIIGYNIKYQLKLLEECGLLLPEHIVINDIMEDFSILYGDYNPAYGCFNNKTLAECAKYFKYEWNFNREFSNNVLYCEAILYFYRKLADMKDIINFNKKMKKQY